MCSNYVDQQLEFELTHEDDIRSPNGVMQVQRILFDEESVVDSISSRSEQI